MTWRFDLVGLAVPLDACFVFQEADEVVLQAKDLQDNSRQADDEAVGVLEKADEASPRRPSGFGVWKMARNLPDQRTTQLGVVEDGFL